MKFFRVISTVLFLVSVPCFSAVPAAATRVSLQETLARGVVRTSGSGDVEIVGRAVDGARLEVRVTTSEGASSRARVGSTDGSFRCLYPKDFDGAPPLNPSLLYVDATDAMELDGEGASRHQAERRFWDIAAVPTPCLCAS
jgi:hypothetical protein